MCSEANAYHRTLSIRLIWGYIKGGSGENNKKPIIIMAAPRSPRVLERSCVAEDK